MKNNPLQTFQASTFGVSQAKVSKIYRALLSVLDQTLQGLHLAPCLDSTKKPRNKDLSFSQKLYNQVLSSTSIVVEPHRRINHDTGLKRLRILKDVCRVHSDKVRDRIRVVGCGLHNLRVIGIDATRGYQHSSRLRAYTVIKSE